MILKISIDVTKIDKKRLYKGKKGTYLNAAILLRDEPDQYGNDGFIAEEVTKEERESGTKGTILGNVKKIEQQRQAPAQPVPNRDFQGDDDQDLLPF